MKNRARYMMPRNSKAAKPVTTLVPDEIKRWGFFICVEMVAKMATIKYESLRRLIFVIPIIPIIKKRMGIMGITKFATYSCARSYSTCISSGRWSVLIVHGEKAHSCYFSRDAYAAMTAESKYTDNKELMIIPDAVHTDLYDNVDVIPFDKLQSFFEKYL